MPILVLAASLGCLALYVLQMGLQHQPSPKLLMMSLLLGTFVLVTLIVMPFVGLANYRAARAGEAGASLATARRLALIALRLAILGVALCALLPTVLVFLAPADGDPTGIAFVGIVVFTGAASVLLNSMITFRGIKAADSVVDRRLR